MYSKTGLSDISKKVQDFTLLNLTGLDALDKQSFHFQVGQDKEDPDVLIKKFDKIMLDGTEDNDGQTCIQYHGAKT